MTVNLEDFGRRYNYGLSIIHDQTKVYEPGYNETFGYFVNKTDNTSMAFTDGKVIHIGNESLHNVTFEDSQSDNWIEAADLLMNSLNRFLKAISNEEEINPELLELGGLIESAVYMGVGPGDSVCSESFREIVKKTIQES